MSKERILVAGAGGQGIIFLGKLMANAALNTIPHVTFFPSYGIEVRGGASHCQVILSDDEISSPVSARFDSLILMNQESMERFLPQLDRKGVAVVNSSLCESTPDPRVIAVPATREADRMGALRSANLIMLGTLLARRTFLKPAQIETTLRQFLTETPGAVDSNVAAFHAGLSGL